MYITRDMIIRRLSEKSGFFMKDIKYLLKCLDEVVLDCYGEVTDDEDVVIQLLTGAKLLAHVVPERSRVDPRNGSPIMVPETVKPSCKFSQDFKTLIQKQYEEKKDD